MGCKINWQPTAYTTFYEEIDFINLKWNKKEVIKFIELVDVNLERLSNNPFLGKQEPKYNLYCLVISKQTTLYYKYFQENSIIELFVFWNNSKNPDGLVGFL